MWQLVLPLLIFVTVGHRKEGFGEQCLRNESNVSGYIGYSVRLRERHRAKSRHHVIDAKDVGASVIQSHVLGTNVNQAQDFGTRVVQAKNFSASLVSKDRVSEDFDGTKNRQDGVYKKLVDWRLNYSQHKGTFIRGYAKSGNESYLDLISALLLCESLGKDCTGVTCEDPKIEIHCTIRRGSSLERSDEDDISYLKLSISHPLYRMRILIGASVFLVVGLILVMIGVKLLYKTKRGTTSDADFQSAQAVDSDAVPKKATFQWTPVGSPDPDGTIFASLSSGTNASSEPLEDRIKLPWSEEKVVQVLRQNNVPVDTWVEGAVAYLVDELMEEKAHLCTGTAEGRASRRGNLLRVVEMVEVVVLYKQANVVLVETVRIEVGEIGEAESRAKFEGPGFGTASLPKIRRKNNEGICHAATRLFEKKIGIPMSALKKGKCCATEEVEKNPNFQGLKTLVRKHILTYEITSSHPVELNKLRLKPIGKWLMPHDEFEIGWKWMPVPSHQSLQDHLGWIQGGGVPPKSAHTSSVSPSLITVMPWNEENVNAVLQQHGTTADRFDCTLQDLELLLLSGEAYFATRRSDQELMLLQDEVLLRAVAPDGAVLTQQTDAGPALPRGVSRWDESFVTVAHRTVIEAGEGLAALHLDLEPSFRLPGAPKKLEGCCSGQHRRIIFTAHVQRSDFKEYGLPEDIDDRIP